MAGPIIALGGGGFAMQDSPSALDAYIVSRARSPTPRVCFVPTASGDSASFLVRFYRAFAGRGCTPTDLTLFDASGLPRRPKRGAELREHVLAQDVIYVGGGNTASMLAIWRAHGLDVLLREAHAAGTVLCGLSAGMICWFEAGVTDSFGALDRLDDGLGLLRGSACPHYDGEAERRPTYHALVAAGFPGGHAADDGAALVFEDGALAESLADRPGAGAYRVALVDGVVVEERLPARRIDG
jgi:peptidase E